MEKKVKKGFQDLMKKVGDESEKMKKVNDFRFADLNGQFGGWLQLMHQGEKSAGS